MLTVLMPVKNHHPPFLDEALDSLKNQTCPDWRLRIVVDASDRLYFEDLLAGRLCDPRIALVTNEGRKLAGKYNTGMRHADTEFVAALLSDDLWSLDAVEVLLRNIRANPDVDFFHSSRRFVDANGVPLSSIYPSKENVTLEDFRSFAPVKHLLCWRRELALSFCGMDESLNSVGPDDYDFPWLMAEHGARFKAVPECLYIFRDHREAFRLTTHLPLDLHVSETRRILEKHGLDAAAVEARLARAQANYLRQCLYESEDDKAAKERAGHDPRSGWREPYY
jgi:glycosyltransferase involved in cell wall biosynthesis